MEPLAIASCELTRDDYIAYYKRQLREPVMGERYYRNFRRSRLFVAAIVMVVVFCLGNPTQASPLAGAMKSAIWLGAGVGLALLYLLAMGTRRAFYRSVEARIDREIGSPNWPGDLPGDWLGPFRVELGADGVTTRQEGSSMTTAWGSDSRIVDEADAVYMELGNRQLIRVPGHAFVQPADREQFLKVARSLAAAG